METGTYFCPQTTPGDDLVLEVVQVGTLHAGEPAGPFGTRVEGRAEVGWQRCGELVDPLRGDLEICPAGPSVEPLGVPANLLDAAALDGRQHLGDGRDDLRVRLGGHILTVRLPDDREGTADPRLVLGYSSAYV